jgi:membrane protein
MPLNRILNFFKTDLWKHPFDPAHRLQSFLIKTMRVMLNSAQGFVKDDCFTVASALSFDFLLSVIPVLAVAFGIAKGFGLQHRLEEVVLQYFYDQPDLANRIISFAYSWLSQTQGGVIAGIGVLTLFWTVLRLIGNIEDHLNKIWHVSQGRSFWTRLRDYAAILFFCPIFFSLSSSLTIFITTQFTLAAKHNIFFSALSPFVFFLFRLIPYVFSWLLFTFFYLFIPNTKVSLKAGIIAGILAGTAYQIIQWLYILFQIGVSSYGAIYGGFAAVPLFLVWLYISWMISLAGAEVAYHLDRFTWEESLYDASGNLKNCTSKRLLGILITYLCVRAFSEERPPPSIKELSQTVGTTQGYVQDVVQDLIDCHILSEVKVREQMGYFQPARHIDTLTLGVVSEALDSSRKEEIPISSTPLLHKMMEAANHFDQEVQSIQANTLLSKMTL